mgnify:CR=1 FL=1
MQVYVLQRWAPKQKQRIPEIVSDVDTQQNHTTLQLYLLQRWFTKKQTRFPEMVFNVDSRKPHNFASLFVESWRFVP